MHVIDILQTATDTGQTTLYQDCTCGARDCRHVWRQYMDRDALLGQIEEYGQTDPITCPECHTWSVIAGPLTIPETPLCGQPIASTD